MTGFSPELYVLHASARRTSRVFALPVISGCLVIAVGGAGLLIAGPHQHSTNREILAFGALSLFGVLASSIVFTWSVTRSGFYATPNELGTIGLLGSRRASRERVARWVRTTVVNPLGLGPTRRMRYVFGVDADNRRVLALAASWMDEADLNGFLEFTHIPVEGQWKDRSNMFTWRSTFPPAASLKWSAKRKLLMALMLIIEGVVLALSGFIAYEIAR